MKKQQGHKDPKFKNSVHRVTKEKGIELEKIIKDFRTQNPGELRTKILHHLEDQVEAMAPPVWIVIETPTADGQFIHESLFHFSSPMFMARAMDFHEHDNLLIDKATSTVRLGSDGTAECLNGAAEDFDKEEKIKITDSNLPLVDSYFTDGEVVFAFFQWIETAPASVADFRKLMKAADHAYHGEIDAYDTNEYRKSGQISGNKSQTAIQEKTSVQLAYKEGVNGIFLSDAQRTAEYPTGGPKKEPRLIWHSDEKLTRCSEEGGSPVIVGGKIFTACRDYNAYVCASDMNGKLLWKTKLGDANERPYGSACIDRGILFLPTNFGVHALDTENGDMLWLSKTNGIYRSSPLVADGCCFIGSKGYLNAIDIESGKKRWRFKVLPKGEVCTPAYKEGILYFRVHTDNESYLYALDAQNGKNVIWKIPAAASGYAGPLIVDDLVVFAAPDNNLAAADISNGKILWTYNVKANMDNPLAAGNNIIVIKDTPDHQETPNERSWIHGINQKNGKVLWKYSPKNSNYIGNGGPVIADGVIYLQSGDGLMAWK
ncbi:MAG: PQQ-like beta-propeller repeat protein [Spirochaetales bacterium]|nr:PQQ-like beta-propeller repeat protein [Spirochaetales bacterium]